MNLVLMLTDPDPMCVCVCVCVLQDWTPEPEHGHAVAGGRPPRNGPRSPADRTGLRMWCAGRWACGLTHTRNNYNFSPSPFTYISLHFIYTLTLPQRQNTHTHTHTHTHTIRFCLSIPPLFHLLVVCFSRIRHPIRLQRVLMDTGQWQNSA